MSRDAVVWMRGQLKGSCNIESILCVQVEKKRAADSSAVCVCKVWIAVRLSEMLMKKMGSSVRFGVRDLPTARNASWFWEGAPRAGVVVEVEVEHTAGSVGVIL